MPSIGTQTARSPKARCARAIRVSVPPSPLLSARNRMSTYFRVTMMISDHRISDRMPRTTAGVGDPPGPIAVVTATRNA